MSTATPGYVFQYHVPPTSSPFSRISRSIPASAALIAVPMPENPAPMITSSRSGCGAEPLEEGTMRG
jgi:hypothetical protein